MYPWPELEISDSKPNGTIMNFETNSEMCWIRVPNNPVHMQHAHVVNRSPQIAELNIVTMTHTHAHFQVRFVIQYSRQHCEQISARFWFWPKLMPATSKQRHVCEWMLRCKLVSWFLHSWKWKVGFNSCNCFCIYVRTGFDGMHRRQTWNYQETAYRNSALTNDTETEFAHKSI